MFFHVSPEKHRKIEALLLLAILSVSEMRRVSSNILVSTYFESGGSARKAESLVHGRHHDGPKHTTIPTAAMRAWQTEAITAHPIPQSTNGGPTLGLLSLAEVNRSSSVVSLVPPRLPAGKPVAIASRPAASQGPRSHIGMGDPRPAVIPRRRRLVATWRPPRAPLAPPRRRATLDSWCIALAGVLWFLSAPPVLAATAAVACPPGGPSLLQAVPWRRVAKALAVAWSAWIALSLKQAGPASNPQRSYGGQPIKCPWPFVLVALPWTDLGRRSLSAGFHDWQTWAVISLLLLLG